MIFSVSVRDANTCGWTSSPKFAGFAKTVKCKSGTIARSARFVANTSIKAKSYEVVLIVRSKTTTTKHWSVVQMGKVETTTTTAANRVTTTMVVPVTTTTEMQIFDQATTFSYDGFLSYTEEIGGLFYATEDSDLTITGYLLSPGGGTVTFYDANGSYIRTGVVDSNVFETVVSCEGLGLAADPPTPSSAIHSGTQGGYNDGHGTSYAGSSVQGSPDP